MSIHINVLRAYFEMARAISDVLTVEMKKGDDKPPDVNEKQMANIQFSLVSTIIIQCYMTIESTINNNLKDLWKESHKRENGKSIYHEFYEKYGCYENFEDLKNEKALRNLGDRIKIICKTREIPQLHESDKETWEFFKKIEKVYRHYLIHIYPDNTKFHDLVNDILTKNELGDYLKTVQKIISHFYTQEKLDQMEWLDKNTLYKFSGIEYL